MSKTRVSKILALSIYLFYILYFLIKAIQVIADTSNMWFLLEPLFVVLIFMFPFLSVWEPCNFSDIDYTSRHSRNFSRSTKMIMGSDAGSPPPTAFWGWLGLVIPLFPLIYNLIFN